MTKIGMVYPSAVIRAEIGERWMPPGCPMAGFTFISRKNYIVGTLIHVLLMATSKLALGILLRGLQKLKKEVEERRERLQKELKTTDEEIYGAVMDARKVREVAAIAGTGDHDVDDDAVDDTSPSRKEALQASLTITKYLQDFDDSFARKLEAMLSSFGHKTRLIESQNLKPTLVTDYFPRIN